MCGAMNNENELPCGDPESPPLSFEEIEARIKTGLEQIDLMANHAHATKEQIVDMTDTVILGALAELFKTLRACGIAPKTIIVPGSKGHG